jgi:hypothetical protein
LDKKYLGLIAASALVVLMVQPAAALIKQSRWAYDVSPNAYLGVWDVYDLEKDELADILSNEDKCPQKCTNRGGEGGGGGGSDGFGAALGSGQSFAAALLGIGGGGGGAGSGKQSPNELDPNGPPFDTPNSPSISGAPLPAALPLFATGLGAMGLFGWWKKRKAAVVRV